MRGFLVFCIVAVATAIPQGYNYQQQAAQAPGFVQGPSQQYLPAPAPGPVHYNPVSAPAPAHHYNPAPAPAPAHHYNPVPAPAPAQHYNQGPVGQAYNPVLAPSFGGVSNMHFSQHGHHAEHSHHADNSHHAVHGHHAEHNHHAEHSHHAQHEPIVTKNFYIHSAPEETEEEAQAQEINAGPAHKHYRVVFIKAPAQSSKAAAISLAQAQNEEKTVIYVLSKKTDAADIQADIQAAPTVPSKPEVFFIKYKTQEEAQHAQQQIQAQYDALGGSSHVSDEGIAPVQSFIGALGDAGHDAGHNAGHDAGSHGGQHAAAGVGAGGAVGGFTSGAGGFSGGAGGFSGGVGGVSGGVGGVSGGIATGHGAAPGYLPPSH